jgi:HK97 family phage portal protein
VEGIMNLKFWARGKTDGKTEKKDALQYQDGVYYLGSGQITAPKIKNYLQAKRLNDAVNGCLGLITLAAIDPPWFVYRREGKNVVEVKDHSLVNFIKRPAKNMSWVQLIEIYLNHILLAGNFYARKLIGSFGTYGEVEILRPDRITITDTPYGVQSYDYVRGGRMTHFKPEEILHIKLFNPANDKYGLSPIASVATQIDIASYSQAWMLALLEQGAMPAVAFSTDGSLEPAQREYLKEQIKEKVLGYENVMNPLVLEGGLKPEKLAFAPKEVELTPLTKNTLRKICSVLHVASELLGDSENKTYSNIKEARKALYEEATFPYLNMLCEALNHWLVPDFDGTDGVFLGYDTSNVDALAEDKDAQWKRVNESVDKGTITRNEGREIIKLGKAKEKGADRLTVAATVMPLDAVTGDGTGDE